MLNALIVCSDLMKKSSIEIESMLMLALIVIIVLGLAVVVDFLVNKFAVGRCIEAQMRSIDEVEDLIKEAKETGRIIDTTFEVKGLCIECIWRNTSFKELNPPVYSLNVKLKTAVTPLWINVSMNWINLEKDLQSCTGDVLSSGGHMIEIDPYNNQVCIPEISPC